MAVQRDKVIASAEKLVAKGKIEPAIKEYERLLEDNPNDVNTLNRIGDLWVRINRSDEAVKVFGKIADHYAKDGFFLKAIAIFKKINKLDPSKLEIYAKLADLYAKQGLAMEAKGQYQVLADYYIKHGDPGNALATYRKICDLDPNSINVHVKLADLYSQNNQQAEALKEYDRVGRMLLKRGMMDEALQVFRKALKIDATNIDLAESLVSALVEAKDYDNAVQIINSSLEANRENPRLLALLGKTFLAKGDVRGAREALERGLASNPTDTGSREGLAEIHLRQGNSDEAFSLMSPVVDAALNRSEGKRAVEMLQRILKVDQGHIPTLEKMVAVYTRLREETNVLGSMNSLAEAHISKGNNLEAAGVLGDLIKREPQNAQHREKLSFVQQKMSGGGPASAPTPAARPAPPPPSPPPPAAAIELDFDSGGADLSFDLDGSSSELDMGFSPAASPAPAPPPRFEAPSFESGVDEIEEAGGDEDLDFITEHITEAEVFAKYGLADKAIEHLKTIIERAPKHGPAYEKLLHLYMDEGQADKVRELANSYIAILREKGELSTVDSIEQEVLTRGYSLVQVAPAAKSAPPPRITSAGMVPTPSRPAPVADKPIPAEMAPEEEFSIDIDEPDTSEVEFDLDSMPLDDVELPQESVEPLPEETFGGLPDPNDTILAATEEDFRVDPAVEELGEIDFYLENEIYDEARGKLKELANRFPGHPEIVAREDRLKSGAGAPKAAAAAPPPLAFSAADIESELLSAIPDEDDEMFAPPPMQAPVELPKSTAAEENLFADEDDFFDLAAELEDELGDEAEESISLSEEEQSLEQIFKEFKKGVEQQLDSEDYDTHYNLGIAYKEMGLIDEAIGEFQLASKDPKRAIECCSMLGLCFNEKGMPQLAIKWYRKGLEVPTITEDEHMGLLYDLGGAYLDVGDTPAAQKAFMEVYGLNTNYRDIVSRMKQLQGA